MCNQLPLGWSYNLDITWILNDLYTLRSVFLNYISGNMVLQNIISLLGNMLSCLINYTVNESKFS